MKRFYFSKLLQKLKEGILKEDFRVFDVSLWLMDFLLKEGKGFLIVYENGKEEVINDTKGFKKLLKKLAKEAEKDKEVKRKIEEVLP